MNFLKELELEEKIAQMLIVGINGTTVGEETRALIEDVKVGGVILYANNTPTADETFHLTYKLQELAYDSSLPLVIAIDEEHGRVHRIKEGTTHFVDMATVGRLNDPVIAKEIAAITSRELIALGINMNFAPVCDVNVNEKNDVIGDRSFSSDPNVVADMITAYIKEGMVSGLMLCAKHFPGHGDTEIDSHLDLPVVDKSLDELLQCELVPFDAATRELVPAIMTAHILFPQLDDYPATMSKIIISDILIKRLWHTGVIISDDMCMGAIMKNYGLSEAFTRSINAGVNMFIVSNMLECKIDVTKLVDIIKSAVESGDILEETIDSHLEKIIRMKKMHIRKDRRKDILRKNSLMQENSLRFAKFLERKKNELG